MGELVPARAGRAAGPWRQAVAATAVRGLSRFAAARGIPPGREFLLDYDVIEAFCVAGLPGCASSTRGTYRSALYRLAEAAYGPPGQRPTPFAGARALAPYSPAERAELAAVAAAQRDPVKRSSALAAVVIEPRPPGQLRRQQARAHRLTRRVPASQITHHRQRRDHTRHADPLPHNPESKDVPHRGIVRIPSGWDQPEWGMAQSAFRSSRRAPHS